MSEEPVTMTNSPTNSLPPISDKRWEALVSGEIVPEVKMLALRIMLSRSNISIREDPSPTNMQKIIKEIYQFLRDNPQTAQADIAALFK
jgi:hypothetical protein